MTTQNFIPRIGIFYVSSFISRVMSVVYLYWGIPKRILPSRLAHFRFNYVVQDYCVVDTIRFGSHNILVVAFHSNGTIIIFSFFINNAGTRLACSLELVFFYTLYNSLFYASIEQQG